MSPLQWFCTSQFGKEKKEIRIFKSKACVLVFRFMSDSFDIDFPKTS